ncbi:MAG: adenosylcobinamide-GDP ribazoletransferase [Bryobacteraceae bacterium]|nr:adenosylcobinamide-GDP ribazoletransferase [Bryobacteraceae bacterium]
MRAALQFLTILPVPAPHVPPGAAAVWFPLVGALIGLAAAAAWHTPLGATAAIVVAVVLTGGLHEDGLADVCDAVRAGRSRERMLEILKDSRIGAYGAIAIVLSILVRWQAMSRMEGGVWWKFVLAHAAARSSMVLLAATTQAAAPGLGDAFRASLPRYAAPLAALQTLGILIFIPREWPTLLAVAVTVPAVRLWLMRRLGGFTGDCLGFQCQIAEAAAWVVLAWR